MTSAIKIRNLSKIYALAERGGRAASLFEALRTGQAGKNVREVRALNDVSFDIVHGERVGIIGSNGAGKTTLLSILAGLTDASEGTVDISGDVHAMLTIGDVVRDDLTGRENIYLDASVHGRKRSDIDAAVEEVIAFTELGEFIERPVRTYSSGMKARLAFAMGAFINADILILDETLSVGDVFFEKKASARMREVARGGSIVIMVSHGLKAIVELCTRCLWFEGGKLVMDGDPETVARAYEKSVQSMDEADLRRKFGAPTNPVCRKNAGKIDEVALVQAGEACGIGVAAMQPLTIEVHGDVGEAVGACRIQFGLVRVDGRNIWDHDPTQNGIPLPKRGKFIGRLEMNPFILGADLYRLDIALIDDEGVCDTVVRVFEVVDAEGQSGGTPLLLHSPEVTVTPSRKP
jgi:lipopolysaccharide transport system ATP-binding protein